MTAVRRQPVRADRNFAPFLLGLFISNCGTWVQNVAQAILVYRLTDSSLIVGSMVSAQFIGTALVAPWSGAAADRWGRRRVMACSQIVAAVVAGLLAAAIGIDVASYSLIFALVLVVGLSSNIRVPAMRALVPDLVVPSRIGAAATLDLGYVRPRRPMPLPVVAALVLVSSGPTYSWRARPVADETPAGVG